MRINYFVTENTVTLYWDKPDEADENTLYEIFVNNNKVGETGKTHFTIGSLSAQQKINIAIKSIVGNSSISVTTAKAKNKIDITSAPYFAICDGKR